MGKPTLNIFACGDRCARKVYNDNQPDMFPGGYRLIKYANDLAGLELESIEIAKCDHRWTAGTRTAWKHLEWCVWQLDPVEERWAIEQREMGVEQQKERSSFRLARDSRKDS